jgi:hypothetical protein
MSLAVFSVACLLTNAIVSGLIGSRLLFRRRAARQLPELLIGTYCLAVAAIGYPLVSLAMLIPIRTVAVSTVIVGDCLLVFGCCCLLFFTARVFRGEDSWAPWFAALGSIVLGASGVATISAFVGSTTPAEFMDHARLPIAATDGVMSMVFAWTALEGMRFHRRMRKRLVLGLAEPIVTNRFLLWMHSGIVSFARSGVAAIYLARNVNFTSDPIAMSMISLSGLVNAVLLVLIFMPPAAYTSWVERSSRTPAAAAT